MLEMLADFTALGMAPILRHTSTPANECSNSRCSPYNRHQSGAQMIQKTCASGTDFRTYLVHVFHAHLEEHFARIERQTCQCARDIEQCNERSQVA